MGASTTVQEVTLLPNAASDAVAPCAITGLVLDDDGKQIDAVLLGMGGPDCGDIIYFLAEGYNYDHADSISTTWGEADTPVSPIFIAADAGFKEGFYTDRIIRQVDFTATVAAVGGVRMPVQCEGAPVYQILAEVYKI